MSDSVNSVSVVKQVAKKFGIPVKDLKAVIFVKDRRWTEVVVFGSKTVSIKIGRRQGLFPSKTKHKEWSELTEIPEEVTFANAADYGHKSGTVLRVLGLPEGHQ